jgi:ribosomal protein S18 acetylase RimI-like enzyme
LEWICLLYNEFFAYNAEKDPVYCRAGKESGEYPKSVIESGGSDLIVADIDGVVIGFIHIREAKTPPYDALMQNHYAQIIDFIVTASHRKQGVGTKLMEAAKQWAKKRDLDYIELFVLSGAENERSFYQHSDFTTVIHTMRCML